jgi:putative transposase
MQLIAEETALQFNKRKRRSGAFWEDRYHATAVQNGKHLRNCMTYIDLNMVRAGVVDHPRLWPFGGFNRIQKGLKLEYLLDTEETLTCLQLPSMQALQQWQEQAVREALLRPPRTDPKWTQAIAIGDNDFLKSFSKEIHLPLHKHSIDGDVLYESPAPYRFCPFQP